MYLKLAALLVAPLALWIVPILLGPTLTAQANDFLRMISPANGAAAIEDSAPEFAHWLLRSDVARVWSFLSPIWVVAALWFFRVVVPAWLEVFWTLYDYGYRIRGAQFIPNARVLEPLDKQTTLDDVRQQNLHGEPGFADPAKAASALRSYGRFAPVSVGKALPAR
jgi:hypothetical protein